MTSPGEAAYPRRRIAMDSNGGERDEPQLASVHPPAVEAKAKD